MSNEEGRYEVVSPLGRLARGELPVNAGISDLDGKRIAFVWDHLFKGDEILDALQARLSSAHPTLEFVGYDNFVGEFADDYRVFEKLGGQLADSRADAAVVAVGACGRCTAGVMRAAAVAEGVNIPAVAVVSAGFEAMARSMATIFGDTDPRLAVYPGAIQTDTQESFELKVQTVLDEIEAALGATKLASGQAPVVASDEPAPSDVVFSGTFDEVEEHFLDQGWSDGLPVVPPTLERVQRFLDQVDLDPQAVLGVIPPDLRELSVWTIAVNGVMAGCKPEYMPVLVAIAECLVDARFRTEDLTSTFGLEPLVVVSGPIVRELDFNTSTGAMRLGRRANTSIGRFVRLLLRNVGGLRIPPGNTDAGAIGYSFNVAMAEDAAATAAIDWPPFRVDNGFSEDVSTVSLLLVVNHSAPMYTAGETAEEHLDTIARILAGAIGPWAYTPTVHGGFNPLILMSPNVANALHGFGYDKDKIRQYIYDHMRIEAGIAEGYAHQVGRTDFSFDTTVEDPALRELYVASDDPKRLIPMIMNPDWLSILIGGNPGRNQSRAYIGNMTAGPPVTKEIRHLPKH